jgi:hypothetical protein
MARQIPDWTAKVPLEVLRGSVRRKRAADLDGDGQEWKMALLPRSPAPMPEQHAPFTLTLFCPPPHLPESCRPKRGLEPLTIAEDVEHFDEGKAARLEPAKEPPRQLLAAVWRQALVGAR